MRTRLDLFVLAALAVYRVWRLVARDKITSRWRETLYNRWPPNGGRAGGTMRWNEDLREMVLSTRPEQGRLTKKPQVAWASQFVSCPWCSGAWLAAAATIAVDASFGVPWPVMWWLALSTAVGLLGRVDTA